MLTKKQKQKRKQDKQQEEAAIRKLARQLGRDPETCKAPKVKPKIHSDLSIDYRVTEREHESAIHMAVPEREEPDHVFVLEDHDEREAEAQKEIERKKLRVAPLWNKGGYMYITDETDPTTLGRKV